MQENDRIAFIERNIRSGARVVDFDKLDRLVQYDLVVDVSSDPKHAIRNSVLKHRDYVWFPMTEVMSPGMNSIYAAMCVLFNLEQVSKDRGVDMKAYVCCDAGVVRSPLVRESYFFMRTGSTDSEFNRNFIRKYGSDVKSECFLDWAWLHTTGKPPQMYRDFLTELGKQLDEKLSLYSKNVNGSLNLDDIMVRSGFYNEHLANLKQ